MEGRRLLEFCDKKELCVVNTWFYKEEKRKIIYSEDVKQKLILRLRRKIQKACRPKGCESNSMGTSAQAGGRRSG